MRAQYEQQVAALHDKLRWYTENQELLTEHEAVRQQQASVIADLQNQLDTRRAETAPRQVADLKTQVCRYTCPPPALACATARLPSEGDACFFAPVSWNGRSRVLKSTPCAPQVAELKDALAGKKEGVVATLVREAAAPMHEQEEEARKLRAEVDRHRQRADSVRVPVAMSTCSARSAEAVALPVESGEMVLRKNMCLSKCGLIWAPSRSLNQRSGKCARSRSSWTSSRRSTATARTAAAAPVARWQNWSSSLPMFGRTTRKK